MMYRVSHPSKTLKGTVTLSASKSESNRILIIQALCRERFEIKNIATAEDTVILKEILDTLYSGPFPEITFNVGGAGTAMRFLTAYFSVKPGIFTLTGNDRMKKRPIGILVDALRQLGADIEYLEDEGFPPLKITGKTLKGGEVLIDGNVSSQFISALLLISPELHNGLTIQFKGKITSRPYIDMTLKMMQEFRVYGQWQEDIISVSKQNYHIKSDVGYAYEVEGDWSSASYWYAIAALSKEADFYIKGLKHPSLQGDSVVADLFSFLGIKTIHTEEGVHITKFKLHPEHLGFDFSDCPDLVQTISVTVSALNMTAYFNGLHTLKIKETDRIIALKNELNKIGVEVEIENDSSIKITAPETLLQPEYIAAYDDHRMVMAFAALAMKSDYITIENPEAVIKSYRDFWEDLKNQGFLIESNVQSLKV